MSVASGLLHLTALRWSGWEWTGKTSAGWKLSSLHSLEVQAQMEGHSFVWLNQLMACVATTVEKELHESRIPEQSIRDAVNGARRKGLLVAEKSSGNASGKPLFCVYLRRYWALECDITFLCHTLHHCMNAACGIVSKADVDRAIQNVQMKDGFLLDDTQKQAKIHGVWQ